MWKKIDSYEMIADIIPGHIITNKPGHPGGEYIIQKIHAGYVNVIHANGISAFKAFPEKDLLSGNWRVKE